MPFWSYWRLIFRGALRETFSHARQKILLGLMLSAIAFLLQWRVLQLRNWTDTEKIITSLLGAALIVMAVSLAKNLVLGPVLLHRKQQGEIDGVSIRLGDASSELAQAKAAPPVTPHEQEQQRLASEKMADFTGEEAKIIEALLRYGEVQRKDVASLGVSVDLFYAAADKGKRTGLVKEKTERHHGGIVQSFYINPAFDSALQRHFALPRSQ